MTCRLVVVVSLGLLAGPTWAGAQALADTRWSERTATIASLTVMIDSGEDDVCRGAGIVVGIEQSRLYVLTAEHVVRQIREEGGLTGLGARFRFARPFDRDAPVEQRGRARVLHTDAAIDLAALEIDDPALARLASTRLDFRLAGDSEHLVPRDPVYAIGCGDGLDWDIPIELTTVLARPAGTGDSLIPFSRTYVREGYSGGPLVHVFDTVATIVGMTLKVGDDVGRAAPLQGVLDRARAWRVPVQLTAPETVSGCRYDLTSTSIVLTGEKRVAELAVKTAPDCPWGIRAQVDRILIEREGYWLEVSGPDGRAEGRGKYKGPGRVEIVAGEAAPCNGKPQRAVARIAGRMIQIAYDGRCTTAAPPSKVARNPAYVRRPPGTAPPSPGPVRPLSIDTSPTAVATARAAITTKRDAGSSTVAWGCTLYGCRFAEPYEPLFCSPTVTRVELGASADRFTVDVDRAACGLSGNERTLCQDAPHLPFPMVPGASVYARVRFADGTTLVKPLPVDTSVLQRFVAGSQFSHLERLEDWTVLEPVPGRNTGPVPFAAIAYTPDSIVVGGYFLFVGLRGCQAQGTEIAADGWWIDEDGKGLLRRRQHNSAGPGFGPQNSGGVRLDVAERMASAPIQISIAADTSAKGRLGPYTYRFDPKAPILAAAKRAGPPQVLCRHNPTRPEEVLCAPAVPLAWLDVRAVRFGPEPGDWQDELVFGTGSAGGTRARTVPSRREFSYVVPHGWPAIFHQLVYADGRLGPPERLGILVQ